MENVLIDKEAISAVIDQVGVPVKIYLPNYTADVESDLRSNYLSEPVLENALIRTRTDTMVITEQGGQAQGDALGYFKWDSKVASEAEIHVPMDDQKGTVVYFVISTQTSRFENSVKMIKGILQKRRYEILKENV